MAGHITLIGDSIFDNAVYVPGGPSVIEHVRRGLPVGWKATLIAVDGATVSSVERQLERIPQDTTHLVLSAGGNNALWMAGNLFSLETVDVRDSLRKISEACQEFRDEYRSLINELRQLPYHVTTCTIYDSIPGLDTSEVAGLCLFNDFILRMAFEHGLTLIDLRVICNETTDYAPVSPIEPSASGGGKIARAILRAVENGTDLQRVVA